MAVASLERKAEREGNRTIYQFYAPVGAVMSGSGASSSIVQNIGGKEKAELLTALEGLREAISRAEEFQGRQKQDLLELAFEARSELDRESPNGVRFTSVLGGLAVAVQAIGSLEPAYKAVKMAAAAVGFHLP